MSKVVVIIPYYQQSAGVLRKALISIGSQLCAELTIEVMVVDDESPAPVDDEINNLAARLDICVLRQKNGGPGSARNRGLEAVSNDCDYVAFLDSDDEWLPGHLTRAVTALDQGFDFYFSNLYHLDQDKGAFERAGRLEPIEQHSLLNPDLNIYAYQGDFTQQIVSGNVVGTPTVVFRHSIYKDLRFDPSFRQAGEDYLFWLACSSLSGKVSFSIDKTCRCGRGVNVFSGAEWGTEALQTRLCDEIKYKRQIYRNYASEQSKPKLLSDMRRLRVSYFKNLMALTKRLKLAGVLNAVKHIPKLSVP